MKISPRILDAAYAGLALLFTNLPSPLRKIRCFRNAEDYGAKPFRRKKKPHPSKQKLFLFAFISVIFLIYFPSFNTPGVSAHIFNSDFLHVAIFSEALSSGIHAFETWRITPSPYLLPDIVSFYLLDLIIGDGQTTYVLFLFLDFIFLYLALYKLYRIFFDDDVSVICLSAVALWIIYTFHGPEEILLLNQFAPVNHLSAFIVFSLLLKERIQWSVYYPVWLAAVLAVSFSDPVFVLYFVPVQLLYGHQKSNRWLLALSAVCGLMGVFLFKLAYDTGVMRAENAQSLAIMHWKKSFANFYADVQGLSSSGTFPAIAFLVLLSPLTLLFNTKRKAMLCYIIFGVPLLVCVLGYVQSIDTFRYFSGSLFMGVVAGMFVLVASFKRYMKYPVDFLVKVSVPLSVSVLAVYLWLGFHHFFGIKTPDHIVCMERYAKENDIDYVIAGYWYAKPLLFHTDGLRVLQSVERFRPNFHEFNTAYYDEIKNSPHLKGAVFSVGIHADSIALFRDKETPVFYCGIDSLMVLDRYPF